MTAEEQANTKLRSLAGAMSHPVQSQILVCLSESADASPNQVARRSGIPVRSVRHHLGQLEKDGLVERTRGEKRRGVHQYYYGLAVPPHIDTEGWQRLSPAERLRASTECLKNAFYDISASLAAETFDLRPDRCVAHVRVAVDEQGWHELASLHVELMKEAERIKAECAERLHTSGARPIRAVSTVMCFELPPLKTDT